MKLTNRFANHNLINLVTGTVAEKPTLLPVM